MIIAVGTDHAGYPLKAAVIAAVKACGNEVIDVGTYDEQKVDFPDYAYKIGKLMQNGDADRGIALCGSGVGVCIAINKMEGVYASVCHDTYSAHQGVEHDDMKVLCIGARIIGPELARLIVSAFLSARFVGLDPGQERHAQRVGKIRALELRG